MTLHNGIDILYIDYINTTLWLFNLRPLSNGGELIPMPA